MDDGIISSVVGAIAFAIIVITSLYLFAVIPAPEPYHSQIMDTYYSSVVLISIAGTIGFISLLIGLLRD